MIVAALVATSTALAQPKPTGSFVATLGNDTLLVESFTRGERSIDGIVVTRSPVTRIMRYRMDIAPNGRPTHFEMRTSDGEGKLLTTNGMSAVYDYVGDSLVRQSLRNGGMDTLRIAIGDVSPFPSPTLPYLGQSFLMYELAFNDARRRAAGATETSVSLLTSGALQRQPSRSRIWFIGNDSVEMDYFGVARSGYRFGTNGQLLRADWTGTTYRYRIARVPPFDVEAVAKRWSAADARGASVGALSPRDTSRTVVDGSAVLIDYSRPSSRGRNIWGDVVPWGRVWRLGADFATHIVFADTMTVGSETIPAGTYTMWMLPLENGESQLIINRQTRIFGTNYNPAHDLARIPMQMRRTSSAERLTITTDSGALRISWGGTEYFAPIIRAKPGG
jgi:hypothetical protein